MTRRTLLKKAASSLAAAALMPLSLRTALAAEEKKSLIVFYSRSGNTRMLAHIIHERLGGDILELTPVVPYPSDYGKCVERGRREREENIFPALVAPSVNPDSYDVVLAGSPNWWGTWAGPLRTFLHEHSLAGKTVLPFNTHGGGGAQTMPSDIAAFCPQARILEGLFVRGDDAGNSASEADAWLRHSGLIV